MKHFSDLRRDSDFCMYIGAVTYFEEYQGEMYTYLLDKVYFNGMEESLLDCKHSGKLSSTCKGGGRARVICKGIHKILFVPFPELITCIILFLNAE